MQAEATTEAARQAGLSPGDCVGGRVAKVPAPSCGAEPRETVAALVAICAELSTLIRDIHRLTALLRRS